MSAETLRAQDLMTKEVVTVPPEMSVAALAGVLTRQGISAAPVTDAEGRLLGIVTEADLLRRLADGAEGRTTWLRALFQSPERLAGHYARVHGLVARDVMTAPVVTVAPEAGIAACAALMEQHRVKRLPVLREGQLVGILSRADLLAAVLEPPRIGADARARDAEIRALLRAEMRECPWASSLYTFVDVRDGVVTLSGFVRSEEVRQGLRVLAGRTRGVTRVEDKMEVARFPLPSEVF